MKGEKRDTDRPIYSSLLFLINNLFAHSFSPKMNLTKSIVLKTSCKDGGGMPAKARLLRNIGGDACAVPTMHACTTNNRLCSDAPNACAPFDHAPMCQTKEICCPRRP
jgi:hypothetical protein